MGPLVYRSVIGRGHSGHHKIYFGFWWLPNLSHLPSHVHTHVRLLGRSISKRCYCDLQTEAYLLVTLGYGCVCADDHLNLLGAMWLCKYGSK